MILAAVPLLAFVVTGAQQRPDADQSDWAAVRRHFGMCSALPERFANRVGAAALNWYFVDGIWLAMFYDRADLPPGGRMQPAAISRAEHALCPRDPRPVAGNPQ